MRGRTPGRRAKEWLSGKLAGAGVEEETDEAGNQWFTLRGASDRTLLIGGHIDSVPNGGWLDGCLNVVAGVEVLRRLAEDGEPALTVRLVNWADEEGARFGRSLFGSSAAAGSMSDQDELRQRKDADGVALPDAIAAHGVDLDRALDARKQLEHAVAYLELHIEQGPVLESMDLPLGVVLGTFGVERHQITWRGQAAHAGSTPMDKRRDALAGAAKLALEIRPIAAQVGGGAVCTSGGVVTKPGIVTSVVETAEQLLDQRHLDADSLAELLRLAKEAAERFAEEEDLEVEWERIWSIEPILFDAELIELADESIREVAATSHRLPSGPLHDAAEVARAGIPTVMLFVQSLRGLSHTKLEDTKPEHLELAVEALDRSDAEGARTSTLRVSTPDAAGPNLFVVGAAKSGTTSLWTHLDAHPDVFMSRPKEPHFFSRATTPVEQLVKDPVEYAGLFARGAAHRYRGDASPSYLWDPDSSARIREAVPGARIIISLRDPVERAYSNYLGHLRAGLDARSFLDAIRAELADDDVDLGALPVPYVTRGFYDEQVAR